MIETKTKLALAEVRIAELEEALIKIMYEVGLELQDNTSIAVRNIAHQALNGTLDELVARIEEDDIDTQLRETLILTMSKLISEVGNVRD